jgi:hypothetical protein
MAPIYSKIDNNIQAATSKYMPVTYYASTDISVYNIQHYLLIGIMLKQQQLFRILKAWLI